MNPEIEILATQPFDQHAFQRHLYWDAPDKYNVNMTFTEFYNKNRGSDRVIDDAAGRRIRVTKLGFVYSPELEEKTGGRFTSFYFTKRETHLIEDLLAHAEATQEEFHEIFLSRQSATRGDEVLLDEFRRSPLSKVLPVGRTQRAEVQKLKRWISLDQIIRAKVIVEQNGQTMKGALTLLDRYVPIALVGNKLVAPAEDGSGFSSVTVPNVSDSYQRLSVFQSLMDRLFNIANCRNFAGRSSFYFCHYDLQAKSIVLSPDLNEMSFRWVQENIDIEKVDVPWARGKEVEQLKKFFSMETTSQFLQRVNQAFQNEGLGNYKVVKVIPGYHRGTTTIYHWHNNRGYDNYETKSHLNPGFWLYIEYDGVMIIGPKNSRTGGFVFVRADEKITLVNSRWCQHVTRWSGSHTDQLYKVWRITDWISGPFREKHINILPKPKDGDGFVFMGRKSDSQARRIQRQDIVSRLRSQQLEANRLVADAGMEVPRRDR